MDWPILSTVTFIPLVGALFIHAGNGWVFTNANGGWEYPVFLAFAAATAALLGDGAFAVRNLLGPKSTQGIAA